MEDDEIEIEPRTFLGLHQKSDRNDFLSILVKKNKKQFVKFDLDFSVLVSDPSKVNIENVRTISSVRINR